jgi:hypothetical protein
MKRICDPSSGKFGNAVYAPGRNGQIVRTRAIPANPRTTQQSLARANMTTASRGWEDLTELQRIDWREAAAKLNSKPRLGMSGPLTGNQYFCKVNAALLETGGSLTQEVPDAPTFDPINVTAFAPTSTGEVLVAKFAIATLPTGCHIYGAAPTKGGVARVPQMVRLGAAPAVSNGFCDFSSLYTARFGVPAQTQKMFVGIRQLSEGIWGQLQTYSAQPVEP